MARKRVMTVTLTVRGDARSLSTAEKLAALMADKGQASDVTYVWPVPVACYLPKSEEASEIRRRNYFDAIDSATEVEDSIIRHIVDGATLTVNVESGAILSTDKDSDTYANVVAVETLRGICTLPGVTVNVAPGSEDPRLWVPES